MHNAENTDIRLRYKIEWLVVRIAFWFFLKLGRQKASAFGGWLARKIGPLMSVHKIADRNIRLALPDVNDHERSAILKRMWDNLGRNVGELPYNKDLDFEDPDVELVGVEYLRDYMSSGESAFFLTGHYGPWELATAIGKYCKVPVSIVYRAANNPLVDAFFQKERFNPDINFIPKGSSGARGILKALKKRDAVALLNDQKQNNGVPIPFFGRDAMTAPGIAELAVKMNLPIYPVKTERLNEGKMRVTIYAPISAPQSGDRKQDVIDLLTTINKTYENWIRERPDHWFWVHNRWSN